METDELQEYLNALGRSDNYRVDAVLSDAPHERTERVFYVGNNGSELGPFIRKTIATDSGQGRTYEKIFRAQHEGKRFVHMPRIFECYVADSSLVVLLEYVEGETLQDYVGSAVRLMNWRCASFRLFATRPANCTRPSIRRSSIAISPRRTSLFRLVASRSSTFLSHAHSNPMLRRTRPISVRAPMRHPSSSASARPMCVAMSTRSAKCWRFARERAVMRKDPCPTRALRV